MILRVMSFLRGTAFRRCQEKKRGFLALSASRGRREDTNGWRARSDLAVAAGASGPAGVGVDGVEVCALASGFLKTGRVGRLRVVGGGRIALIE